MKSVSIANTCEVKHFLQTLTKFGIETKKSWWDESQSK